jgi:hypothetical protein
MSISTQKECQCGDVWVAADDIPRICQQFDDDGEGLCMSCLHPEECHLELVGAVTEPRDAIKELDKTRKENVILRAQLTEANARLALWVENFHEGAVLRGPVPAEWRPEKKEGKK